LGGGSTPQPLPKAKVPNSITARKKKKAGAEARRCLPALDEAEEPYEAGVSAVPPGGSRMRDGVQPSDEDTWRRFAITAESLAALMDE